jgi:hypothetical protein
MLMLLQDLFGKVGQPELGAAKPLARHQPKVFATVYRIVSIVGQSGATLLKPIAIKMIWAGWSSACCR